jgi:hypothetical protein
MKIFFIIVKNSLFLIPSENFSLINSLIILDREGQTSFIV